MIDDKEKERRLKISQTLKGRIPWNKGLKAWRVTSPETRRKIGLAHKGKKVIVTDETRKKISKTMKGKMPANLSTLHILPRTEEWRRKIGLSHKGMKHTDETKLMISEKKRKPFTKTRLAIRQCYKYRAWRSCIFKRDNFTCQICNKRGGRLNVDHIKPFSIIVKENNIKSLQEGLDCEELWDIINGRTLCILCHRNTPSYAFKSKKIVI